MQTLETQQDGAQEAVGFFTARVHTPEFQAMVAQGEAVREEEAKRPAGQDAVVAGDIKVGGTPLEVEPLAGVIRHPPPSNEEHGLVAVPVVRHWLFVPNGSKLCHRDICVRVVHKGREITQRIRVGDRFAEAGTGYGVLKVRHQRLLFAVQDLWQQQGGKLVRLGGGRSGIVCASSCDLESRLLGSHGGYQQRIVRSLIQQVTSIPIAIENYVGTNGRVYDIDITGLIAGAQFLKTKRGGRRGTPWVEIYLSPIVTEAFAEDAFKPLNLKVLNSFRSELSALIYPKTDYYLASHPENEMRLDGLVDKLGLTDKQMRKVSYRRSRFTQVATELDGQPLSKKNCVIDARIVATSDGRDDKLVTRCKRKES